MATISYRRVLRLPQVPQVLACACFSPLADRMFMLAIVLYALQRYGSPTFTGWVAFAAVFRYRATIWVRGALPHRRTFSGEAIRSLILIVAPYFRV